MNQSLPFYIPKPTDFKKFILITCQLEYYSLRQGAAWEQGRYYGLTIQGSEQYVT